MRSRLHEVPRYSTRERQLEAATYNRVRLGLRRLGRPLRFALPGLRTLEMILDDEAWVCVDARLDDYPILAWLEFATCGRTALHTPIRCRLYSYHAHGGLVERQVLDKTDALLARRLSHLAADRAPGP